MNNPKILIVDDDPDLRLTDKCSPSLESLWSSERSSPAT